MVVVFAENIQAKAKQEHKLEYDIRIEFVDLMKIGVLNAMTDLMLRTGSKTGNKNWKQT